MDECVSMTLLRKLVRKQIALMTQIMFETFNVPALHYRLHCSNVFFLKLKSIVNGRQQPVYYFNAVYSHLGTEFLRRLFGVNWGLGFVESIGCR